MTRAGLCAVAAALTLCGGLAMELIGSGHAQEPEVPANAAISAEEQAFFERQVRPLLIKHCYECHSSEAKIVKGGLRLDSRGGWMKGGDSGTAIVPGSPETSRLIEAVRYQSLEMPPSGKLPATDIAVLEKWIGLGAPDPRVDPAPDKPAPDKPAPDKPARDKATQLRFDAARSHWAFQPVRQSPLPDVKNGSWPHSDTDRFILSRLESEGLAPVADADKPTLVRRIFFDLVGLPPTPDEIASFLADESPDALEKVVDSLLARPEFGRRWGRHWLDVARYADSNGSDENFTYYDSWRFRNYVIDAFNADKPFHRFITEQLAGDLVAFSTQAERDNNLVATGFLVVGPKVIGATDKKQLLVDVIDEQLDSIGKAFLGLTIGCARCHDHKFDPISTRDYYALAGILSSTETIHGNLLNRRDLTGWNLHPLGPDGQAAYDAFLAHEKRVDALTKEQKELQTKQQALKKKSSDEKTAEPKTGDENPEAASGSKTELQETDERLAELKQQIAALKKSPPPRPPLAMSVNDQERPGPMEICVRGDAHNRGEAVPRGFVSVVAPGPPTIGTGVSGRAELAAWLVDQQNPLTSRVAVNRVWQHMFGQGLVGTPDDFGTRGERPSHPELLDHLALQFMRDGWSVKRLVRSLVLSRSYQLGTGFSGQAAARDPENRWLWRMNRRRLQVEALRDSLLSISGQLDRSPTDSVVAELNVQATGVGVKPNKPIHSVRRTVFLPVVRNDLPPLFQLFDFGDSLAVNGRRSSTNVAPQALFMMNSPLVVEAAMHTAETVLADAARLDERQLLERLYTRILGRPPHAGEVTPSLRLVHAARSDAAAAEPDAASSAQVLAWAVLSQALFCSSHFQFLD